MHFKIAERLMRGNFFGPDDWKKAGVRLTKKQLEEVYIFPWSEQVVRQTRESHFVFLGIDSANNEKLSTAKLAEICEVKLHFSNFTDFKELFTEETCGLRWYLMPFVPYEKADFSHDRRFEKWPAIKAVIPDEYEIPTAAEEFAKHVFYLKKKGWKKYSDKLAKKDMYGRTRTFIPQYYAYRSAIGSMRIAGTHITRGKISPVLDKNDYFIYQPARIDDEYRQEKIFLSRKEHR